MKITTKQTIKNSFIGAIVFSITVLGFGLAYGAWTTISTETDGQPLSAAKWNTLVNRLNSIDEKQLPTAWVNFNGTSCTGGAGNECVLISSYNILKVTKSTTGQFIVYFLNNMDNNYYGVIGTPLYNNTYNGGALTVDERISAKTVSSFPIGIYTANGSAWSDSISTSVTVFGGKTY
ncbi:MAG: hypothetical protein PHS49_04665 [Candidatus Gracilibacteria bacterium]|nr:hypothetical protein [Candidatus Gracilibacteria bacterium]